MPDVFVSYSTADAQLARDTHERLSKQGVEVFVAELSLLPGQQWSETIWEKLRASDWVLLLASKRACASPYVQQEFGMALGSILGGPSKAIVPVVWDLDPSELPGWMSRFQAIDLRKGGPSEISKSLDVIAARIHAKKQQAAAVLGALFVGLLLLAVSEG